MARKEEIVYGERSTTHPMPENRVKIVGDKVHVWCRMSRSWLIGNRGKNKDNE